MKQDHCVDCGRLVTRPSSRCDLCNLRQNLQYRINGLEEDARRAMGANFEPGFVRANAMAEMCREILNAADTFHQGWMRQRERTVTAAD